MPLPVPPIVAIQFAFAITALGLAAGWYALPALRRLPLRSALPPLLLVHLVRPISMWLLAPGAIVKPTIPESFATQTAYGDILSAMLALGAAVLVRREAKGALAAAWVFSVVGFADVVKNVLVGLATQAPTHMGAMAFVPAYGVPVIIVSHLLIFKLLLDARKRAAHA